MHRTRRSEYEDAYSIPTWVNRRSEKENGQSMSEVAPPRLYAHRHRNRIPIKENLDPDPESCGAKLLEEVTRFGGESVIEDDVTVAIVKRV